MEREITFVTHAVEDVPSQCRVFSVGLGCGLRVEPNDEVNALGALASSGDDVGQGPRSIENLLKLFSSKAAFVVGDGIEIEAYPMRPTTAPIPSSGSDVLPVLMLVAVGASVSEGRTIGVSVVRDANVANERAFRRQPLRGLRLQVEVSRLQAIRVDVDLRLKFRRPVAEPLSNLRMLANTSRDELGKVVEDHPGT